MLSKFQQLRSELYSTELSFLMEAHSGLSAKIVQETGFRGIWASGLSISSLFAVRDCNELSWTQVLEVLECMVDVTSIPILLDGDTGYGNFNNARRLVRKLCQIGVAGVCIEDKMFPKMNSLLNAKQSLADIDEFCGKIKARKDSQTVEDFCLVARVEALVYGYSLTETLHRADAYLAAGADAILIHSKKSTPDEIIAFSKAWHRRAPLIIVPTTYHTAPTDIYRDVGVSVVIWANHNLRTAVSAMRQTCRRIMRDQALTGVEMSIATLDEVFSLLDYNELFEAERRYLPGHQPTGRSDGLQRAMSHSPGGFCDVSVASGRAARIE